ncbi:hypothetical protein SXM_3342 [Shewanella xiamenensis]|nr:hypothetical protein SXM_3342 [Shewanella xiamenensis]
MIKLITANSSRLMPNTIRVLMFKFFTVNLPVSVCLSEYLFEYYRDTAFYICERVNLFQLFFSFLRISWQRAQIFSEQKIFT